LLTLNLIRLTFKLLIMFKYTVRSASGKIIGKAITKEGAENIKKNAFGSKNCYIKSNKDPVYPLKEQTNW
jgi:hypothetical protein